MTMVMPMMMMLVVASGGDDDGGDDADDDGGGDDDDGGDDADDDGGGADGDGVDDGDGGGDDGDGGGDAVLKRRWAPQVDKMEMEWAVSDHSPRSKYELLSNKMALTSSDCGVKQWAFVVAILAACVVFGGQFVSAQAGGTACLW